MDGFEQLASVIEDEQLELKNPRRVKSNLDPGAVGDSQGKDIHTKMAIQAFLIYLAILFIVSVTAIVWVRGPVWLVERIIMGMVSLFASL